MNFLAAHLLAALLRGPLAAADGARIVNVSSSLARTASMNWNDPNRAKKYSRVAAYARSQLALSMGTSAMAPEDTGITAVSVNPGLCDTALLPLYGRVGAPPASPTSSSTSDPAGRTVSKRARKKKTRRKKGANHGRKPGQ